ncbi:MAG: copper amine oxidase N-terminal domain-containing protein [Clostridiales bacterium]|jgi:hypothetical protein|nr:copper amine oxidase N-terminal domain-containing protein [Clostridiales bacterium]
MKKKVALLLAVIMTLSLLPMNVFAATDNVTVNNLTVPAKSLLFEEGLLGLGNYIEENNNGGDAEWYVDGTNLVIPLKSSVKDGFQFQLNLTNAKWFFRQLNTTDINTASAQALGAPTTLVATGDDYKGTQVTTYDTELGAYYPTSPTNYKYGTYYRWGGDADYIGGIQYEEVPYSLLVSYVDQSRATLTIKGDHVPTAAGGFEVKIPLVSLVADDTVDATVSIVSGNSSTVSSQRLAFASANTNKVNVTVKDPATSRDTFYPGSVVLTELRPSTIKSGDIITLELPSDYAFNDLARIQIGLEPGLSWADGTQGLKYGALVGSSADDSTAYWTYEWASVTSQNDKLAQGTTTTTSTNKLRITLKRINRSEQLPGALYIDGIRFDAFSGAPFGDIKVTVDGTYSGSPVIGKRVDWNLVLEAIGTVPTLVTGRYIGPSWSGSDAADGTHKTAGVKLTEAVANSWWGARQTVLSLPATDNNTVKGAKFRKIKVTDVDNIANISKDTVVLADGVAQGPISLDYNKIVLTNLSLDTTKSSTVTFDLWVSVEYGFGKQTGDLKIAIDPSTTAVNYTDYPSVVIAHTVDPITVATKVTDLKIGYQYQPVADIQITENLAKALLAGKTVRVSITDLVAAGIIFTPQTTIKVTSGDLKIKNISTSGIGGFTSQSESWLSSGTSGSTLSFDIEKESTVASTITIANAAVQLDRTVPVTNKESLRAVIWGTAIAENYGLVDDAEHGNRVWRADFNTVGEIVPYINVISAAEDQPGILTQEVKFVIGEAFYSVNGVTYSMEAASYISTVSNSTMVPARFLGNALGIRNDSITWDDVSKTATFLAPSKVIQFQLNNSNMIVDGVAVPMVSPDGKAVAAEIKNDRIYIPMRAFGYALGVSVDWDAATSTAIYNKGANANAVAAETNTTPVVTP